MTRKSGLDVKKAILKALQSESCSLRDLETKVNTNYLTIRKHCEELEYFGIIKIEKHKRNDKNGRPYTIVTLMRKTTR